jgi:hypothetical protein
VCGVGRRRRSVGITERTGSWSATDEGKRTVQLLEVYSTLDLHPEPGPAVPCLCVLISLIALMMEAASISETSVNFYQTTRCNNPEDSNLHTRRRENLKSH